MAEFQKNVKAEIPLVDDAKMDEQAPDPWLNIENAFVHIDGKRHKVVDLLRLLVTKLT